VKGGRAPGEEASSPARFRNGGKHPDWPQSISLRGAVEAVNLGRSATRGLLLAQRVRWGLSSPLYAPLRRLGCSRNATRRGPCLVHWPLLARSRPVSSRRLRRDDAALTSPWFRPWGRAWKGPRSLSRWRIDGSFEGVPARQNRCRNRQASPGPEKQRVDPFLTEHRLAQTGSRAHAKPRIRRKGEARR